jgi:large subunit ribosomal protein L18
VDKNKKLNAQRQRRRFRVRKSIRGSAARPRLCISRSLSHFGCQVIDDDAGKTLVAAHSANAAIRGKVKNGGNCEAAAEVGRQVAKLALDAGIKAVSLDRGHNRYHGRVKAFADAAREAGLEF